MKEKRLKKHLNSFNPQNIVDTTGGHTTKVYKKNPKSEQKEGSQRDKKVWFIKSAYSPTEPLELEVISGEIYRLWVGNSQPKTRIVTDSIGNRYVASEGAPGFITFRSIMEGGEEPTDYKTLARILVSSLILAETDLKSDNIGVNSKGQVVKIDHDSSLWALIVKIMSITNDINKLNFTSQDLDNILFPPNYKVTWAGGLKKEIKEKISNNEEFREEVYSQILKILVMPPDLLAVVQAVNASDDLGLKREIACFIQERLNLLRHEALKSASFRAFLANLDIKTYERKIENEIKEFLADNRAYSTNLVINSPVLGSLQEIKTTAATLDQILAIKQQLKIDPSNEKHLVYWQEK